MKRGLVGRLFEDFEQAVGRLFHEGGGGEDGEGALGLDGRTVVGDMDDLANLAELDEQLRRVRGNDEHVGMSLMRMRVSFLSVSRRSSRAATASATRSSRLRSRRCGCSCGRRAEVGEAVGLSGLEAVDGFGEHEGQGIFACAFGAGEDERAGKSLGTDGFAQVGDRCRVAEEVLEAHGMRIEHWRAGSGLEDEDMLAELKAGEVGDCFVEGNEDAVSWIASLGDRHQ